MVSKCEECHTRSYEYGCGCSLPFDKVVDCRANNYRYFQPREAALADHTGEPAEMIEQDHIRDSPKMVEPAPGEPVVIPGIVRELVLARAQFRKGSVNVDEECRTVIDAILTANPPAESPDAKLGAKAQLPPIETLAGSCPELEYPYTAEEGKLGRLVREVLGRGCLVYRRVDGVVFVRRGVRGYDGDTLEAALEAALADAGGN